MKKRDFLKITGTVWATPVIYAVVLPAHAQTSTCTSSDVIGEWSLAVKNSQFGFELYVLNSDNKGTHNEEPLQWNVSDNQLIISLSNGALILMDLSEDCNSAAGTITFLNESVGIISGTLNG